MVLDHFHAPLAGRFGWQGFHTQWAGLIAADLNRRLPEGWRAEAELNFGIKINVGVVDEGEEPEVNAPACQQLRIKVPDSIQANPNTPR